MTNNFFEKGLLFISQHEPNNGQIALANSLGFDKIIQRNVIFKADLLADLLTDIVDQIPEIATIPEIPSLIAIVAPAYIINELMNRGFTLLTFENYPEKRQKKVFVCKRAWKMWLNPKKSQICQEAIECPLSIDRQYTSAL